MRTWIPDFVSAALIEPHYPKAGNGRQPVGLAILLRTYFLQQLEKHDLGGEILDTVNRHLETKGIRITTGTIVDATIIHAPSSTKNASGERDEREWRARPGDAPDTERQAVVFRGQSAHRRG